MSIFILKFGLYVLIVSDKIQEYYNWNKSKIFKALAIYF